MLFPISKLDVAALRKADDISFHTCADAQSSDEGKRAGLSYIRATKRAGTPDDSNPFAATESHREVSCGHSMRNYDPASAHQTTLPAFRAFEMLHSVQHSDEWQTIACLLKEGDAIRLDWCRNGRSCPVLDDANMVGDSLTLTILRGDKRLAFLVNVYVGQNNTARMVKA